MTSQGDTAPLCNPMTSKGDIAPLCNPPVARLLIEYDGTHFAGWARQPGRRTVQGELEAAIARVRRSDVALTAAGRTDAGVHARGQVASHPGEPADAYSLNGVLASDVRVLSSEAAPEGFDARHDALARTYRYRVLTGRLARVFEQGRSYHWRYETDRVALDTCAELLVGTHDFTAFTLTKTTHRHFKRTVVSADWREEGDGVLAFWIEADAFLRRMVRTLVGTMLRVGIGRVSVDGFADLLQGRSRTEAADAAPAHGLYLERVRY